MILTARHKGFKLAACGLHGRSGDGLDFDKLASAGEHGYAKAGARHMVIAKDRLDHFPGGNQIARVGGNDVDGYLPPGDEIVAAVRDAIKTGELTSDPRRADLYPNWVAGKDQRDARQADVS